MNDERFDALLKYSTASKRVCPQPAKWGEFWQLLGSPHDRVSPPLILGGWSCSGREKRERFKEHIRYAANNGLLAEAEKFIRALPESDWHTCPDGHLDWSYDSALIEDEEKRHAAVQSASTHFEALRRLSDNEAFNKNNLAQTLFFYHLLFPTRDAPARRESLQEATGQFSSSAKGEYSILEDVPSSIARTLEEIDCAKRVELLLLQLLACITDAGIPLDRDEIEEFVQEVIALTDPCNIDSVARL
jgi:hypothetical protein